MRIVQGATFIDHLVVVENHIAECRNSNEILLGLGLAEGTLADAVYAVYNTC